MHATLTLSHAFFLFCCLSAFTPGTWANTVRVPVHFDTEFLASLVQDLVYTDAGGTARVWADASGCNALTLSTPEVSADDTGVRVLSEGQGRIGKPVGVNCLLPIEWEGLVEVVEQPRVSADGAAIEFEITDSNLYRKDRQPGLQTTIWKWVKEHAHPRMRRIRIDLKPALDELRYLIPGFLPAGSETDARQLVDSLHLSSVATSDSGVSAVLEFQAQPVPAPDRVISESPLTEQELLAVKISWRRWDAFLTFIIKHTALATQNPDHRGELLDILLDARHTLLDALTTDDVRDRDPVRELFLSAWPRLAPVMRGIGSDLSAERSLQFLSFIAAADALNALDQLTPVTGLEVSTDALRRMARMMLPTAQEDPLDYSERIDPELREAFEFRQPPVPPGPPDPGPRTLRTQPFVTVAAVPSRVADWIPKTGELPVYLSRVRTLLHDTVNDTLRAKPLEARYHDLFRALVLATAWQETCWRQFVVEKGKIRPMRSGAGAVGIMQVVPTVWRGFYDPKPLETDIRYNATAGSEILQHYLKRYAIRKGEHKTGSIDNLARATYAAYNGGPRQLSRYRKKSTPRSLKKIDTAFWDKYRKVRKGNELAVINCYGV